MARFADRSGGNLSRRRLGWGLMMATALLAAPAALAIEALRFFRIGTAATAGTYFQIGGVLASAISKPPGARACERGGSCGVPGLVAVAEASQGSLENVIAIAAGQFDSALVQSDVASWAYSGGKVAGKRCGRGKAGLAVAAVHIDHDGPISSLRAIAGLYPEDVHVVVRADSPIATLRQLRGRKVALGEPQSGTLADARLILETAGLGECDVDACYLRLSEAAEELGQLRIDAFFLTAGYPVPAIADIAMTVPIRLLPIPRDIAERLLRRSPFFGPDVIPAGSYLGLDHDTATLRATALWVTHAAVDADLVYAITKSLWSEATQRLLEAAHPAGSRIRLATALDGVTIPLHPGAARYYREAGLHIPDGL
jgi:TRAP transporter TAXI family solute receptor